MAKKNIFIMLAMALTTLCSCSANEEQGDLNFSVKDRCKDRPVQTTLAKENSEDGTEVQLPASSDTVYFERRENGQVFVNIEIGVSCGDVRFYLNSDMKEDTLFIDAKMEDDFYTSCSCLADVEVDIPNDMISAKYLVLNQRRRFVKTIVFKE